MSEADVPPPPKLPDVEIPPAEEVIDQAAARDEVVERAKSAEEVVDEQPSVDDIVGRDS